MKLEEALLVQAGDTVLSRNQEKTVVGIAATKNGVNGVNLTFAFRDGTRELYRMSSLTDETWDKIADRRAALPAEEPPETTAVARKQRAPIAAEKKDDDLVTEARLDPSDQSVDPHWVSITIAPSPEVTTPFPELAPEPSPDPLQILIAASHANQDAAAALRQAAVTLADQIVALIPANAVSGRESMPRGYFIAGNHTPARTLGVEVLDGDDYFDYYFHGKQPRAASLRLAEDVATGWLSEVAAWLKRYTATSQQAMKQIERAVDKLEREW